MATYSADEENELEARLYEKIYYSNEKTEDNMNCDFYSSSKTSNSSQLNEPLQTENTDDHHSETISNSKDNEMQSNYVSNEKCAKKNRCKDKIKEKKLKKSDQSTKKVSTKAKKSKDEQRSRILQKRKEIREKATNPFKIKNRRDIPELYVEDEENDNDACLLVEDSNDNFNSLNVSSCSNSQENNASNNINSLEESSDKYNIVSKNKKSLQQVNTNLPLDSDSDESILEVPIPPKPAPPLVTLDSDNDNDIDDDDNNVPPPISTILNNEEIDLNVTSDSENFNTVSAIGIDSIETDSINESMEFANDENENMEECVNVNQEMEQESQEDIVLNCTPVKRGVNSLEEIRELRNSINENTDEGCSTLNQEYTVPVQNEEMPKDKQVKKKRVTFKSVIDSMHKNMHDFYNESWGGENFDIEEIFSTMPEGSNRWAILDDDMRYNQSSRYWEVCKTCNKPGHSRRKCPAEKKKYVKICFMCGNKGHLDTRCPDRKCLTCGKKKNTFQKTCENCCKLHCSSCKSKGHLLEQCPDNWRRFHNTIIGEVAQKPDNMKSIMKPKNKLTCCNCTRRGHDWSTCKRHRWSQHFPTPVYVTNYNSNTNVDGPDRVLNPFARNEKECTEQPPTQIFTENEYNNSEPPSALNINPQLNPVPNINPEVTYSVEPDQNQIYTQEISPDNCTIPFNNTGSQLVSSEILPTLSTTETPPTKGKFGTIILDLFVTNPKYKKYIVFVNDLKKEVVSSLIAKTYNTGFLVCLNNEISFSILIEWKGQSNFVLTFSCDKINNVLIRDLVMIWLERSPEEQNNLIMIPPHTMTVIQAISNKINLLYKTLQEPNLLYDEFNRFKAMKLAGNTDPIFLSMYNDLQVDLIISLYKYCIIKKAKSKLREFYGLYVTCQNTTQNSIPMNEYLTVIFYLNTLFAPHEPKNLDKLVNLHIVRKQSGYIYEQLPFDALYNSECPTELSKSNHSNNMRQNTVTNVTPDLRPMQSSYYNVSTCNSNIIQPLLQPCRGMDTLINSESDKQNYNYSNSNTHGRQNVLHYVQAQCQLPPPENTCININIDNNCKNNATNNAVSTNRRTVRKFIGLAKQTKCPEFIYIARSLQKKLNDKNYNFKNKDFCGVSIKALCSNIEKKKKKNR